MCLTFGDYFFFSWSQSVCILLPTFITINQSICHCQGRVVKFRVMPNAKFSEGNKDGKSSLLANCVCTLTLFQCALMIPLCPGQLQCDEGHIHKYMGADMLMLQCALMTPLCPGQLQRDDGHIHNYMDADMLTHPHSFLHFSRLHRT